MSREKIVRMANQIAIFFETSADRGMAVADIADHINSFWPPTMRGEFRQIADADATAFHPLAQKAAPLVRVSPAAMDKV